MKLLNPDEGEPFILDDSDVIPDWIIVEDDELDEANDCHNPAGTSKGGQFCSTPGTGPEADDVFARERYGTHAPGVTDKGRAFRDDLRNLAAQLRHEVITMRDANDIYMFWHKMTSGSDVDRAQWTATAMAWAERNRSPRSVAARKRAAAKQGNRYWANITETLDETAEQIVGDLCRADNGQFTNCAGTTTADLPMPDTYKSRTAGTRATIRAEMQSAISGFVGPHGYRLGPVAHLDEFLVFKSDKPGMPNIVIDMDVRHLELSERAPFFYNLTDHLWRLEKMQGLSGGTIKRLGFSAGSDPSEPEATGFTVYAKADAYSQSIWFFNLAHPELYTPEPENTFVHEVGHLVSLFGKPEMRGGSDVPIGDPMPEDESVFVTQKVARRLKGDYVSAYLDAQDQRFGMGHKGGFTTYAGTNWREDFAENFALAHRPVHPEAQDPLVRELFKPENELEHRIAIELIAAKVEKIPNHISVRANSLNKLSGETLVRDSYLKELGKWLKKNAHLLEAGEQIVGDLCRQPAGSSAGGEFASCSSAEGGTATATATTSVSVSEAELKAIRPPPELEAKIVRALGTTYSDPMSGPGEWGFHGPNIFGFGREMEVFGVGPSFIISSDVLKLSPEEQDRYLDGVRYRASLTDKMWDLSGGSLQTVRFQYDPNTSNAYWAETYKVPNFVAAASANSNFGEITFFGHTFGDREDSGEIFTHEVGHLVSLKGRGDVVLGGNFQSAKLQYEAGYNGARNAKYGPRGIGADELYGGHTSYGSMNWREGFAEDFALAHQPVSKKDRDHDPIFMLRKAAKILQPRNRLEHSIMYEAQRARYTEVPFHLLDRVAGLNKLSGKKLVSQAFIRRLNKVVKDPYIWNPFGQESWSSNNFLAEAGEVVTGNLCREPAGTSIGGQYAACDSTGADQGNRGDQARAQGVPERGGVRGGVPAVDEPAGTYHRDPPLSGLPATVKVDGKEVTFGPYAPARTAEEKYLREQGITIPPPPDYVKVNPEKATRIADAYEAMKHDPDNPEVKAAYQALAKEVIEQYKAVLETGLKIEFNPPGPDPYGNPRNAILDVVNNNHIFIFPTDGGYGTGNAIDPQGNPMLEPSGFEISGRPALVNDLFRVVHDYFGHIKEGVGFRADGEENAWRQHMVMFSPLAQRALTSETRGQNSWVNFGPFEMQNRKASGADTHYAPQKIGLMPEWTLEALVVAAWLMEAGEQIAGDLCREPAGTSEGGQFASCGGGAPAKPYRRPRYSIVQRIPFEGESDTLDAYVPEGFEIAWKGGGGSGSFFRTGSGWWISRDDTDPDGDVRIPSGEVARWLRLMTRRKGGFDVDVRPSLVAEIYRAVYDQLREDNDCHEPAGTPEGGQFCSSGGGTATLDEPSTRVWTVDEVKAKLDSGGFTLDPGDKLITIPTTQTFDHIPARAREFHRSLYTEMLSLNDAHGRSRTEKCAEVSGYMPCMGHEVMNFRKENGDPVLPVNITGANGQVVVSVRQIPEVVENIQATRPGWITNAHTHPIPMSFSSQDIATGIGGNYKAIEVIDAAGTLYRIDFNNTLPRVMEHRREFGRDIQNQMRGLFDQEFGGFGFPTMNTISKHIEEPLSKLFGEPVKVVEDTNGFSVDRVTSGQMTGIFGLTRPITDDIGKLQIHMSPEALRNEVDRRVRHGIIKEIAETNGWTYTVTHPRKGFTYLGGLTERGRSRDSGRLGIVGQEADGDRCLDGSVRGVIDEAGEVITGNLCRVEGGRYGACDDAETVTRADVAPRIDQEISKLRPELYDKVARLAPGRGSEVQLTKAEIKEVLHKGVYGIIGAGAGPGETLTPAQVETRHQEIVAEVIKRGYRYIDARGRYGNDEPSIFVFIPEAQKQDMSELGRMFKQEAVIFGNQGKQRMVYTTGPNAGKANPGRGYKNIVAGVTQFFTEIPTREGPYKFALNFNFNKLVERQLAREVLNEFIRKVSGGYRVVSHQTGKNFGTYKSEGAAKRRLRQMARFR